MKRFLMSLATLGALALPAAPALAHPPAVFHARARAWHGHREEYRRPLVVVEPGYFHERLPRERCHDRPVYLPVLPGPGPCAPYPSGIGLRAGVWIGR